jgi:hypothetical protein
VPWVEGVEADHGQTFLWDGALLLGDEIHVL